jgi:hypothetical protein
MTSDHPDWPREPLAAGNTTMLKKRFLIGATALILVGAFGGASAHAQEVSSHKAAQETCAPDQVAVWFRTYQYHFICISRDQQQHFHNMVKIKTRALVKAYVETNQVALFACLEPLSLDGLSGVPLSHNSTTVECLEIALSNRSDSRTPLSPPTQFERQNAPSSSIECDASTNANHHCRIPCLATIPDADPHPN